MPSTTQGLVRALLALAVLLPAGVARADQVELPLNIGIGPAVYVISGPIYKDQPVHFGLKLSLAAVVDQATLRQSKERIPTRYRKMASRFGEARVGLIYLPDNLIISPKFNNTAVYGATWRPLAIGFSLIRRPRFTINTGLLLTYAYMYSDTIRQPMHFLRPGIDLKLEFEIPVAKWFLISIGWASQFYIPQRVGGSPATAAKPNRAIWHIGQGFILLHFRMPHTTIL